MRPQIMKMDDMNDIWMYLKQFPSTDLDLTLLMALIDHPKMRVSNFEINERRNKVRVAIDADLQDKMTTKVKDF